MKTFAKLAPTLFCVVLLFGLVNVNNKVKTLTEAMDIQLKTMELLSERITIADRRIDLLRGADGQPAKPVAPAAPSRPVVTVPISQEVVEFTGVPVEDAGELAFARPQVTMVQPVDYRPQAVQRFGFRERRIHHVITRGHSLILPSPAPSGLPLGFKVGIGVSALFAFIAWELHRRQKARQQALFDDEFDHSLYKGDAS